MTRIGQIDPRSQAINIARRKLKSALERQIEPSFDFNELAQAIDEFVQAKIADAMDRRY